MVEAEEEAVVVEQGARRKKKKDEGELRPREGGKVKGDRIGNVIPEEVQREKGALRVAQAGAQGGHVIVWEQVVEGM